MKVTVLVGGVGGARFLQGVLAAAAPGDDDPRGGQRRRRHLAARPADLPGPRHLHVHPRRRASTPSAAGAARGRPGRSARSSTAYGADPTWFGLGDRDIATHLVRTRMLRAGYPLSARHRGAVRTAGSPASSCCRSATTGSRPTSSSTTRAGRRPTRPQGDPLPGVVGAAPREPCRRTRSPRSAREQATAVPGRARDAIADADVVLRGAVEPGGQHRHDPRRPGRCAHALRDARRRSSGSRRSSTGTPLRGMADAA